VTLQGTQDLGAEVRILGAFVRQERFPLAGRQCRGAGAQIIDELTAHGATGYGFVIHGSPIAGLAPLDEPAGVQSARILTRASWASAVGRKHIYDESSACSAGDKPRYSSRLMGAVKATVRSD
jgi:hypothetical protein